MHAALQDENAQVDGLLSTRFQPGHRRPLGIGHGAKPARRTPDLLVA